MPHVIVKLQAGRSDQLKTRLAEEVTRAVMAALGSTEDSISVAVEDISAGDWTERVYKPDILGKAATLYKKPGYKPS